MIYGRSVCIVKVDRDRPNGEAELDDLIFLCYTVGCECWNETQNAGSSGNAGKN
ncbi:MAG: hypothetical protein ACRC62_20590 [Microcoleus sp.]